MGKPTTPKFKAVIFDWSGTLSDDFEPCYRAFMDTIRHFGCEPVSRAEWRRIAQIPFPPIYRQLGVDASDEEISDNFCRFFERYSSMPKPFPETEAVLKWLKSRNVETAVLSVHSFVRQEARDYGITEHLDHIGEKVMDKTRVIREFMEKMRTDNNDTLFVGDMVHDIDTARSAEIPVAAVLHGYDSEPKLRSAGPDFVLKDLSGLKALGLF